MRQPEDTRCGCSHTNRCLCLCVIPSASKEIKHLTLKYLNQGPKPILKLIFINWDIMLIKKKRLKLAQEEKKSMSNFRVMCKGINDMSEGNIRE